MSPCRDNDPHETPDRPDWPVIFMTAMVGVLGLGACVGGVLLFVVVVRWVGGYR